MAKIGDSFWRFTIERMTVPLFLNRLSLALVRQVEVFGFDRSEAWVMDIRDHNEWWGTVHLFLDFEGAGSFAWLHIFQSGPTALTAYLSGWGPTTVQYPGQPERIEPDPDEERVKAVAAWLNAMAEEAGLTDEERLKLAQVRGWPEAEAAGITLPDYAASVHRSESALRAYEKEFLRRGFFTGWTYKRGRKPIKRKK